MGGRGVKAAPFPTVLVAGLAGCAAGQLQPIALLSTIDRPGNASKLAAFIEQQCFERADDLAQFEAGLAASKWRARRTQTADPANRLDLDVWEFPDLTLIRGQPVRNGMWTCAVAVKEPVLPSMGQVQTALSNVANVGPGQNGEWWWSNAPTHRLHLIISASGSGQSRAMLIYVEIYRQPWWRGISG